MPVGLLIVLGGLLSISKWEDLPRAEVLGLTGMVVVAAGLAFVVTGGILASTGHTKVTQPLSTPTVSARPPTWSTGVERAPSPGTSFVVPILAGTF